MPVVKFGEWLPDVPDYENQGLTVCTNVLPLSDTYTNIRRPIPFTDPTDDPVQGAFAADLGGLATNFCGDKEKLYRLSTDAAEWEDVSKAGGYDTDIGERWYFKQFGTIVFATNISDPIQAFDLAASSDFADIADMSGASSASTIPKARYITTIGDFLVVANTDDADGDKPERVRWSAINDPLDWEISTTTQANFIDLVGNNAVNQQIVGGEYGVVFQTNSIWRLTYVGSPIIFQADEVDNKNGTFVPGSVVSIDHRIAFLSRDGFYIFDGSHTMPISEGKINRFFFDDFQEDLRAKMVGANFPGAQIIAWIYPGKNNLNGICNRILFFNYAPNAKTRWSIADIEAQHIYRFSTQGYTINELDALYAPDNFLNDIDVIWNSSIWKGGKQEFALFNRDNRLSHFKGASLRAELETGEKHMNQNGRTLVTDLIPIAEGNGTIETRVGQRNRDNQAVSYTPFHQPTDSGIVSVQANARYLRFGMKTDGDFSKIVGIDVLEPKQGDWI